MKVGKKRIDCEEVVKALIDAGLIQFDPTQPDFIWSVWGFERWEHDRDLVQAIQQVKRRLDDLQAGDRE